MIKNEIIYRAFLNFENSANTLSNLIIENITNKIENELHDTECYLVKSVIMYQNVNNFMDYTMAEVIYKNNEGQWVVEDDNEHVYLLNTLSIDKLIEIYKSFERTLENIEE